MIVCCLVAVGAGCGSSQALVKETVVQCPATDRHPPYSSDAATRATLVPKGAIRLTLCRYRGLNPDPKRAGTLVAGSLVATPEVLQLDRFDVGFQLSPPS